MVLTALLLAIAAYNTTLIIIILLRTRSGQPGRDCVWFIGFLTGWVLCEAVLDIPGNNRQAIIWIARAMYVCATGAVLSWLWFCCDYPTPDARLRRFTWYMTGIACLWGLLAWTPYFISDATAFPWQDHLAKGPLVPIWAIWFVGAYLAGTVRLWRTKRHVEGLVRLQIRYILFGIGISFAMGLTFNIVLPLITLSSRLGYIGPLSSLGTTTMMTYAIVRARLLDITMVYRTGLVYSMAIGILSLLFALLVPALDALFSSSAHFPVRAGSFTIALGMALIFQPLHRALQQPIDHYFFKNIYDTHALLEHSGQSLATVRDHETLGRLLADILAASLQPRHMTLFIPRGDGTFAPVWTSAAGGDPPTHLANEHAFFAQPREIAPIILADEALRGTPAQQAIGVAMQACDAAIYLRCIVGERTVGVLLIGPKRSGDLPSTADRRLLTVLTTQISLALDNITHYRTLHDMNIHLEERVRARTTELSRVNDELQQADQSKDRFLAVVSHELLTPLTCILGWVDVAMLAKTPAEIQQAMDVILRNANRQKVLVSDLLDMSRIRFGKLVLNDIELDLWEIARQSMEGLRHTAAARRITLYDDLPPHPIWLHGDSERLGQAVTNLLGNAIKFTPDGGAVRMHSVIRDAEVGLAISDTGKGLTPEQLEEIFQPFAQVESSHGGVGLGLGLAIVRGMVELHGGRVIADSGGANQGSTFIIFLPRTRMQPPVRETTGMFVGLV